MGTQQRVAGAAELFSRAVVLCLCWWAIAEGDPASFVVGVPAVLAALYLSFRLSPTQSLHGLAVLRFLPVFFWRSLVGGADVARRAVTPDLPIQPALREYRTQLPEGLPRVLFANVVSLLPGTLCADLQDDVLSLHILSESAGDDAGLRRLEKGVARIFSGAR
jgi:multicomponent Na+:H+ antiporter subunit E